MLSSETYSSDIAANLSKGGSNRYRQTATEYRTKLPETKVY